MARLWSLLRKPASERFSFDDYVELFKYNGSSYALTGSTSGTSDKEGSDAGFAMRVASGFKGNPVVFACELVRLLVFSEARFQWQWLAGGRPGDLFGTPGLALLERPWPNGTTGELLMRMEQDTAFAGNSYTVRENTRLRRLRPDWVDILLSAPPAEAVASDVLGYRYQPGGPGSKAEPVVYRTEDVAHWSPIPDPESQYRGMSWLTPVVREIQADRSATIHKQKFFDNGASPGLAVSFKESVTKEQFDSFMKTLNESHQGAENAYKTLYLGGGADVTVVGRDLQQLDFKATQGAGEPLALDTPVPTPDGWTTMGEIHPGDEVFGRAGKSIRVLGVSDVHHGRECFRLTFNDRTSVVSDASHVWTVIDRNSSGNPRPEVRRTTAELVEGIAAWRGSGNRYGVPSAAAAEAPERDLLLDPYVLGCWLGDGQTAGAAIAGAADDLGVIASEIESRGYTVSWWATAPGKCDVIGLPGGVMAALRALGVLGDKHIPADYLRGSVSQRLDLLRGLMDTDGTVGHVGHETAEFSSKLQHLARQVAELARSLGQRVSISRRADARSRTGEQWRVTFRANPGMVPFALPRKAERCVTPLWVRNRAIVSIEPVASVPVRCIAVDSPDHLFVVGEGWILTHNTRIAAAAGTPPVLVGLSEGLQGSSLNAGNFSSARRRFADATIRPLWRSASASLETLFPPAPDSRLWYDDRDVPFLREDAKDLADIESVRAATIAALVAAGFGADAVIAAVTAEDLTQLKGSHSGLFSVQLQPPTTETPKEQPKPPTRKRIERNEQGEIEALIEEEVVA